jgi:hypothetical protein
MKINGRELAKKTAKLKKETYDEFEGEGKKVVDSFREYMEPEDIAVNLVKCIGSGDGKLAHKHLSDYLDAWERKRSKKNKKDNYEDY